MIVSELWMAVWALSVWKVHHHWVKGTLTLQSSSLLPPSHLSPVKKFTWVLLAQVSCKWQKVLTQHGLACAWTCLQKWLMRELTLQVASALKKWVCWVRTPGRIMLSGGLQHGLKRMEEGPFSHSVMLRLPGTCFGKRMAVKCGFH